MIAGKKIRIVKTAFVWLLLFFCFFGSRSLAEDSNRLYINELMWQGSNLSTADEWVELYNDSDQFLDISGFYLCAPGVEGTCGWKVLVEDGEIAPKGTYLISNYPKSAKSILSVEPDLVNNDISLSNSKFLLELRDRNDVVVDVAGDGGMPFFPQSSKIFNSMQRMSHYGDGKIKSSWEMSSDQINLTEQGVLEGIMASPTASGRPKIQNFKILNNICITDQGGTYNFGFEVFDSDNDLVHIKVDASDKLQVYEQMLNATDTTFSLPPSTDGWSIKFSFHDAKGFIVSMPEITLNCFKRVSGLFISEILTSPKDYDWDLDGVKDYRDEWIELFNNSVEEISLSGWILMDSNSERVSLSGTIAPNGYQVFYYKDTGLSLNNSSELVTLLNPIDEIVDRVEVTNLGYNNSYAKIDGQWVKSNRPTPGMNNLPSIQQASVNQVDKVIVNAVDQAVIPSKPEVMQTVTIVTSTIRADLALSLKSSKIIIPVISTQIVDGPKNITNPFNYRVILIYFLFVVTVISLTLGLIVNIYEIYRRE